MEQEPFLIVRSAAYGFASGDFRLLEHQHEWRQFLYATSGAMTVYAGRMSWMIPAGNAVIIPAGCRHSMRMWGEVAMRTLYFPPDVDTAAMQDPECRVIPVTPLLRELVLRVIEVGALDCRVPAHERLAGVVLDELARAEPAPLSLPMPVEARAAAVAQDVLSMPAEEAALDELDGVTGRVAVRLSGCSGRRPG